MRRSGLCAAAAKELLRENVRHPPPPPAAAPASKPCYKSVGLSSARIAVVKVRAPQRLTPWARQRMTPGLQSALRRCLARRSGHRRRIGGSSPRPSRRAAATYASMWSAQSAPAGTARVRQLAAASPGGRRTLADRPCESSAARTAARAAHARADGIGQRHCALLHDRKATEQRIAQRPPRIHAGTRRICW